MPHLAENGREARLDVSAREKRSKMPLVVMSRGSIATRAREARVTLWKYHELRASR